MLPFRLTVWGDPALSPGAARSRCGCGAPPWGDGPVVDLRRTAGGAEDAAVARAAGWAWRQPSQDWFGAG